MQYLARNGDPKPFMQTSSFLLHANPFSSFIFCQNRKAKDENHPYLFQPLSFTFSFPSTPSLKLHKHSMHRHNIKPWNELTEISLQFLKWGRCMEVGLEMKLVFLRLLEGQDISYTWAVSVQSSPFLWPLCMTYGVGLSNRKQYEARFRRKKHKKGAVVRGLLCVTRQSA